MDDLVFHINLRKKEVRAIPYSVFKYKAITCIAYIKDTLVVATEKGEILCYLDKQWKLITCVNISVVYMCVSEFNGKLMIVAYVNKDSIIFVELSDSFSPTLYPKFEPDVILNKRSCLVTSINLYDSTLFLGISSGEIILFDMKELLERWKYNLDTRYVRDISCDVHSLLSSDDEIANLLTLNCYNQHNILHVKNYLLLKLDNIVVALNYNSNFNRFEKIGIIFNGNLLATVLCFEDNMLMLISEEKLVTSFNFSTGSIEKTQTCSVEFFSEISDAKSLKNSYTTYNGSEIIFFE